MTPTPVMNGQREEQTTRLQKEEQTTELETPWARRRPGNNQKMFLPAKY